MLKRVDRYLLSELAGPLAIGFLVYTFIMLIQFFFRSTEMIIRRGVPARQVGELLVYYLPSIIVLTLPMALLFGILVAVGRLAGDSELIAMRAGGLSLWRLSRPALLLGVALTLLTGYLMQVLLPRGNSALQDLQARILASSISRQVDARVFYEEWQGIILYVFDVSADDDRWRGVFLANTAAGAQNEVSWAGSAQVRVDPERGNRVLLQLNDVITHKVDLLKPDSYHTSRYRSVERVLEDPFARDKLRAQRQRYKQLRELTIPELRQRRADPELPVELKRMANVEIHKKFSIPFACLVFALLGPPIGFHRQRSGKGSGFALSVGIIFVYWFLISAGEGAARENLQPWLAMWLPNIFFLVLGLTLMVRKNRDRGLLPHRFELVLGSVQAGLTRLVTPWLEPRRRTGGRSRRQGRATAGVVVRIPEVRLRFPNRLDRYVLGIFLKILGFVLLSGLVLILVAEITNKLDDVVDNAVPTPVVFQYLKYAAMQPMYEFLPIAVLVTTLAAFGILSQRNEVTAAKALGISLYRLAASALLGAALVVVGTLWLQSEVLPAANERAARLEDEIAGREGTRTYRRADRNWLFGSQRYIYNYLHYDEAEQALRRLQVFELSETDGIKRRLFAHDARYVGDGWRFEDSWTRKFDGLDTVAYRRYEAPTLAAFPETPEYFEGEVKQAEALTYRELKQHIAELEGSGQSVPELWVRLYDKTSYPAVSLVMALVALPFSFRLGRRGALYGIGIGILLGMAFLGTVAFCTALGTTGALPPLLAVWTPAIAFSLLSLYAFLGVET